ncbi:hypothetical protein KAR91_64255 [Candidatus Pacearchaeota archaeon]|nr:hypothetical protein [Candidatus Pacearchaeota archaeon]
MSKIVTTEMFIERAKSMHGDLYCYDNVIYVRAKENIEVICNRCGLHFPVTPNNHTNSHSGGKGCPECNGGVRKSRDRFIKEAIKKYGDKFEYDKVKYINARTNVEILCKIHGYFEATPDTFLSPKTIHGCDKCAIDSTKKSLSKTAEKFLRDATRIHSDTYEYDLRTFVNNDTTIKANCRMHGEFNLNPKSHTSKYRVGCPECGRISKGLAQRITKEQFLKYAKESHGDRYEYDLTNFSIVTEEVPIKCKEHGWFPQIAFNHYYNVQGCPKCKSSTGEHAVRSVLLEKGVTFKEQLRIHECKNKKKLPFDFSILNKNRELKGMIEFHGPQHFKTVGFFNGEEGYLVRNRNDQIKSDFCDFNNIPLLILSDKNRSNVNEEIEKFLKKIKNKKPIKEFKAPSQLNIFQA